LSKSQGLERRARGRASADAPPAFLFSFYFPRRFGDAACGLRKFLRLPPDWREADECTLAGIEAEVFVFCYDDTKCCCFSWLIVDGLGPWRLAQALTCSKLLSSSSSSSG
jgi:hypothetical protein